MRDSCGLYPVSCQQTRPHCTLEIKYFYPVSLFPIRLENRKRCILSPETLTFVSRLASDSQQISCRHPQIQKETPWRQSADNVSTDKTVSVKEVLTIK
ncbi:hypothetical protein J6590_032290 [Homalodisca vitripennis]|nr:hypothetical protein J6590_032290 [Homalodisca vitripennis]